MKGNIVKRRSELLQRVDSTAGKRKGEWGRRGGEVLAPAKWHERVAELRPNRR